MEKIFISILVIISIRNANAQFAIINDPDGFTNIRQGATNQAKILDTISNGSVVFIYDEQMQGNWLSVDYKKYNNTRSGYIHKSRIIFLTSFTKFNVASIQDTLLQLKFDSLYFTISKRKFSNKGRKITYSKPQGEQQFIKTIDGKIPFGTDGNLPGQEYREIRIKSGKHQLTFPNIAISNLFEPNLDMTTAYYDKATNKIYLEAINSDAAGAYIVIWTIRNLQLVHREIFIPF